MSDNQTPASAGEGAAAPGVASEGNGADAGAATPGEGEGQGNEGGNDDDDLSSLGIDPADKRGLKTRFTTLTALQKQAEDAARDAERRAEEWKAIAEGRKSAGQQPPQQRQPQADPNPAPDPKDKAKYPLGVDDPQYIEDKAVHRIRQENAVQAAEQARTQAAQADFNARRERFLKARDAATANADTPNAAKQLGELPVQFTDEIVQSEHAALIAEHFATTGKAERDKLLAEYIKFDAQGRSQWKSPGAATAFARKIGALESSLPGVFAQRKQTKAGQPPVTVSGAGAGGNKQPKDMDVDELDAWLRKKKAAAGG